jgi:hypothetical protein
MDNALSQKQIEDLQTQIAMEEENYINAVKRHVGFNELKEKRLSIRALKEQLQLLHNENGTHNSNDLAADSIESSPELTE